ncbi:hypothetical protein [Streptomyces globisporus]|nr:hypothetical protein [Streptomyces globisporus]
MSHDVPLTVPSAVSSRADGRRPRKPSLIRAGLFVPVTVFPTPVMTTFG